MSKVVLLINLGSPDSYQVKDVKAYLAEFLMDPYVIDLPFLLRALIVYGFVLPFRPKKTAHAYQQVWTPYGSPLVHTSQKVKEQLSGLCEYPVYLAMRYANPSIQQVISLIEKEHPDADLYVYPLYPQYAMSTTKTVIKEVQRCFKGRGALYQLKPFYNQDDYIHLLVQSIQKFMPETVTRLIFSYHGLPERHLRKTDPTKQHCLIQKNCCHTPNEAWKTCYQHQCLQTTKAVVHHLNKPNVQVVNAFQSRLGKDPWLKPDTKQVIQESIQLGHQHVAVICPAFVTDCLETLEEINMGIREDFLSQGGSAFTYIPCLNDQENWVSLLNTWVDAPEHFEPVD